MRGVPLLVRACEPRCLRRFLRTFHVALSGLPPEPSAATISISASASASATARAAPSARSKSVRAASGSACTQGSFQPAAVSDRVASADTLQSGSGKPDADVSGAVPRAGGELVGLLEEPATEDGSNDRAEINH